MAETQQTKTEEQEDHSNGWLGDFVRLTIMIWAMGVIIYELITFNKPFDSQKLNSLFDMIINKEPHQIHEGRSADIKLLIKALLTKDDKKRPSIFDIAQMPCI